MKEQTFLSNIGTTYDLVFDEYLKRRGIYEKQCGKVAIEVATRKVTTDFANKKIIRMIDVGCGAGHDMILFSQMVDKNVHSKFKTRCIGCDLSHKMVHYSRAKGLNVLEGDLFAVTEQLGRAHLVWAHLSLIHIPIKELKRYYQKLFELTLPGGFVGVGVKTGDDKERIDPKDEKIPVDRFTNFMRITTVRKLLEKVGFQKWTISFEYPSHDPKYNYGFVIMQRVKK